MPSVSSRVNDHHDVVVVDDLLRRGQAVLGIPDLGGDLRVDGISGPPPAALAGAEESGPGSTAATIASTAATSPDGGRALTPALPQRLGPGLSLASALRGADFCWARVAAASTGSVTAHNRVAWSESRRSWTAPWTAQLNHPWGCNDRCGKTCVPAMPEGLDPSSDPGPRASGGISWRTASTQLASHLCRLTVVPLGVPPLFEQGMDQVHELLQPFRIGLG